MFATTRLYWRTYEVMALTSNFNENKSFQIAATKYKRERRKLIHVVLGCIILPKVLWRLGRSDIKFMYILY